MLTVDFGLKIRLVKLLLVFYLFETQITNICIISLCILKAQKFLSELKSVNIIHIQCVLHTSIQHGNVKETSIF